MNSTGLMMHYEWHWLNDALCFKVSRGKYYNKKSCASYESGKKNLKMDCTKSGKVQNHMLPNSHSISHNSKFLSCNSSGAQSSKCHRGNPDSVGFVVQRVALIHVFFSRVLPSLRSHYHSTRALIHAFISQRRSIRATLNNTLNNLLVYSGKLKQ